jgi:hypothetical protein
VEDHLAGKPDEIIAPYRRFIDLVAACGPFSYRVTRTAITLKGSWRGFAGAKAAKRSLDGFLDVQRQLRAPRILRASPYTKRLFVHQFRVTSPDQLDEEFPAMESRRAGRGAAGPAHLPGPAGQPPRLGEGPAQQELDLGVGAAELVGGPPGQGVVDGRVQPQQDALAPGARRHW